MDDDGGLGMRNWAYYEQPLKGNLGLQLMSSVADRNATKPLLSNGGFFHRDCSMPEPPAPIEYVRDGWISHRESKMVHMMPANSSYSVLPDAHGAHALPILQPPEPPKDDKISMMDDPGSRKEAPLKKRAQAKTPKPKKPKKVAAPRNETSTGSLSRGRNVRKSMDVVINGIDLDISGIPTPICSCTGTPQQCYRWGVGGRKMSQGAFKKVLERLAGEGYNLSNPIDLKTYWAKHGTNKFVTIRGLLNSLKL
ncbi:protein Barley B recombinant [Cocos nucifera]|nr:protein Barley B recombinant [Cocos nucifera]